jgi:F-type H+-transporting ATPase subunit delta
MPISHSTNSLTEVYAQSFFETVFAKGGAASAESALDEMRGVLRLASELPQFGEVLSNPGISAAQRAGLLEKALHGRVSDETRKFLRVLNQKDRIGALGGVVASLDKIVQEKLGRVEVAVHTAQEMGSGELEGLRQRLGSALGRDVVLSPKVEPSMIGGIKLRIGDQLIDGSFATQLRKMKDKLGNEGGANLRGKLGAILEG